jgi:hypothetical protein
MRPAEAEEHHRHRYPKNHPRRLRSDFDHRSTDLRPQCRRRRPCRRPCRWSRCPRRRSERALRPLPPRSIHHSTVKAARLRSPIRPWVLLPTDPSRKLVLHIRARARARSSKRMKPIGRESALRSAVLLARRGDPSTPRRLETLRDGGDGDVLLASALRGATRQCLVLPCRPTPSHHFADG